jgi:phosphoserine aminotransferase
VPLVADFSSGILSAQLDVSKFGLIYVRAQKDIGPTGLGVVILRGRSFGLCGGGCTCSNELQVCQ